MKYLDIKPKFRRNDGNIISVCTNWQSVAFLKEGGRVTTWGNKGTGGDSSEVVKDLEQDVVEIHSNNFGFLAVKSDGSVVVWGDHDRSMFLREFREMLLPGVHQVCSHDLAWAVLLRCGGLVVWSSLTSSVECAIWPDKVRFIMLRANAFAFAALKDDGTVFACGDVQRGGDCSQVQRELIDIIDLHSSVDAFAAIRNDGEIVTWGGESKSLLKAKLSGEIKDIYTGGSVYAAVWNNGYVRCKNQAWSLPVPQTVLRSLRSGIDGQR